jgi:hypothetical protein
MVSITIAAINGKYYLKGNSQPHYRPYQPQLLREGERGREKRRSVRRGETEMMMMTAARKSG